MRRIAGLLLLGLALACEASTTPASWRAPSHAPAGEAPAPPFDALSPREVLIRASLDLRGIRPQPDEYARLAEDPDVLDELVDGFVTHPRFGARVRALFAPIFRTRLDLFRVQAEDLGLSDEAAFAAAVGDEPLRLLSHIAEGDLPYAELVTADYTLANELLAKAFPLDRTMGDGWTLAHYRDGRVHSGVLSQNAFYWRYPSDGINYGRGRAAALARIFLCQDYLSRRVEFPRDLDLTDELAIRDAINRNPACVNCHVSLDPLASFLFGFDYRGVGAAEMSRYHPEREKRWERTTGISPGYFGQPGHTLDDLGHWLAGDPRFISCAVERVFEGLLGREVTAADFPALTRHREAFLAGGLTLRSLFRSVVADPRYRGALSEADGGVTRKLVSPELLGSQLEELTTFRFTKAGYALLETDLVGVRALAGGVDAASGSKPARLANATVQLVHERLAEAAAFTALSQARHRLLLDVPIESAEEPKVRAGIAAIHLRLFGVALEADSAAIEAQTALFYELLALKNDRKQAWQGVIAALLRDPELTLY